MTRIEFERYDRQSRIAGWKQAALEGATVLVVGAGALGNEALKNLALLGIGNLIVIDFDKIEESNLSRTALFLEADVGKSKAKIAAKRISEINPHVNVQYLEGNVILDIGMGWFRDVQLVIGCLDNIAARSHVGIVCSMLATPYLDGGMWGLGGEVRWFLPGDTACFECTLSDEDRRLAYERRSCTGFRIDDAALERAIPTTINTAAIIGGILSQETARFLCALDQVSGGKAIVYNGQSLRMHQTTLPRNKDCPYHSAVSGVITLQQGPDDITANSLFKLARTEAQRQHLTLELGRDFLLAFQCKKCGNKESVDELKLRVDESRMKCPNCGAARKPEWISTLAEGNCLCSRKLSKLGVPPREILVVQNAVEPGCRLFYELGE